MSKKGNSYLLVVVDAFSGWPEAFPVRDTKAATSTDLLYREVIARFGVPRVVLADNAKAFRGALMTSLSEAMGVKMRFISVRHPQANGGVERLNKTIKMCLRTLKVDWEEALPSVLLAIRRAPRAPLWISPAEMLFGHNIHGPVEAAMKRALLVEPRGYAADRTLAYRMTRLELEEALLRERAKRDEKATPAQHLRIKQGDLVLTFNAKALIDDSRRVKQKWIGPFLIIRQTSATTYQVLVEGKPKILHVSRLVAFDPTCSPDGSPALEEVKRQRKLYRDYLRAEGLLEEDQPIDGGAAKHPEEVKQRPQLTSLPGVSCTGVFAPKRPRTTGVGGSTSRLEGGARPEVVPVRDPLWRQDTMKSTAGGPPTTKEDRKTPRGRATRTVTHNGEATVGGASAARNVEDQGDQEGVEPSLPEQKVADPDPHEGEAEGPQMDEKHNLPHSRTPEGIAIVSGNNGTLLVKVLSPELGQVLQSYSSGGVFRPVYTDEEGQEYYREEPGAAPKVVPLAEYKILRDRIALERGRLPSGAKDVWKKSLEKDILHFKGKIKAMRLTKQKGASVGSWRK